VIVWMLLMMVVRSLTPPPSPLPAGVDTPQLDGEGEPAADNPVVFMVPEIRIGEVCGGMNEALLLKLVRDWCASNQRLGKVSYRRDGHWWAVQPYAKWAEQMTWLSAGQVGTMMRKLEARGLVIGVRWQAGGVKGWRVDEAALRAAVEAVPGNVVAIAPTSTPPPIPLPVDGEGEQLDAVVGGSDPVRRGHSDPIRKSITPVRKSTTLIRKSITPVEKSPDKVFKRINRNQSVGINQSSNAHEREGDSDKSFKGIDFEEQLLRRFGLARTRLAYEKAFEAGAVNPHAYANRCLENDAKREGNPLMGTMRESQDGSSLLEQDGTRFITGKYADFIQH
jgi:hypothetical protein